MNSTLFPANQINRLEHAAEEAENPTINQIVWTAADTYICPHTHRENHPLSIHSTGRPADGLIPTDIRRIPAFSRPRIAFLTGSGKGKSCPPPA